MSRNPSAFNLCQRTERLLNDAEALATLVRPASPVAAQHVAVAADKLTAALDVLRKEVDRRKALRAKYERDLRGGT